MARGLYEGVVVGPPREFTVKKTGEVKEETPVVITGTRDVVGVPGNGLAEFTKVLILADLRRFENRSYFDGPVRVIQSDYSLDELSRMVTSGGKEGAKS